MYRLGFAALLVAMPMDLVNAQSMPVSTFLAKSESLKKQGRLALTSSDLKLLKSEVSSSAAAYVGDVNAARKAGKVTYGCPPADSTMSLTLDQLIAYFYAIPPNQRRMSVKTAFYALMKKRFPCPARRS
jgi:hypothetical protein